MIDELESKTTITDLLSRIDFLEEQLDLWISLCQDRKKLICRYKDVIDNLIDGLQNALREDNTDR